MTLYELMVLVEYSYGKLRNSLGYIYIERETERDLSGLPSNRRRVQPPHQYPHQYITSESNFTNAIYGGHVLCSA